MPDYLPRGDQPLYDWAANFSALVSAGPSAYGFSPSEAASVAEAVQRYGAALRRAKDPETRTAPAVANKDALRAAMKETLRFFAQAIKRNRGVSNEAKLALGLRIGVVARPAIPAPMTRPVCAVLAAMPYRHALRIIDVATPHRRAKPPGVQGAELFLYVGDDPPLTPEANKQAAYHGLATRALFSIDLAPADVGKRATYYARWITSTGKAGPWSAPVSMTIA